MEKSILSGPSTDSLSIQHAYLARGVEQSAVEAFSRLSDQASPISQVIGGLGLVLVVLLTLYFGGRRKSKKR